MAAAVETEVNGDSKSTNVPRDGTGVWKERGPGWVGGGGGVIPSLFPGNEYLSRLQICKSS